MTREAKIGMLTGLGVIVAIGVLLSEYLGDRNTGPTAVPVATGKMAPLPVGAEYRQQVLAPVSVPAMTSAGGGERTQLPGGGELASPIATGPGPMPPTMFAADPTVPTLPSLDGPVTPIAAGPALVDGGRPGNPPMLTLQDANVPVKLSNPLAASGAKPSGILYTIQPGDSLAKIAKRFYGSAKNSDVARIVAANPGVLKDAGATLLPTHKILIPNPPAAVAAPKPVDPGLVLMPGAAATDGLVPLPGVVQPPVKSGAGVAPAPKTDIAKKDAPKTETAKTTDYIVQPGDTLEKIARKLAPANVTQTVARLTSLNGLKDASRLKVHQVLKVPA